MRPDVTEVDLYSIRELASPPTVVTSDWLLAIADPTTGVAYKEPVSGIGAIVADQIGAAINEPDRYYIVDGAGGTGHDPANDGTEITDPYLSGKSFSLELRGVGFLQKGIEWNQTAGGILLLSGRTFFTGEFYTVHFHPTISSVISTPDAVARFSAGVSIITASTMILPTMYRKQIIMQGAAAPAPVVTLPSIEDYPQGVLLAVRTRIASNFNTIYQAAGSERIFHEDGTPVADFILGPAEWAKLVCYIHDDNPADPLSGWYIDSISPEYKTVGQLSAGAAPGANQMIAEGTELLRAVHVRLWRRVQQIAILYPASVVSGAAWDSDKTKFSTGNGTTTFHIPQWLGHALRFNAMTTGLDPDRAAAGTASVPFSFQAQRMISHTHAVSADAAELPVLRKAGSTGGGLGLNASPGGYERVGSNESQQQEGGGSDLHPNNIAFIPFINF